MSRRSVSGLRSADALNLVFLFFLSVVTVFFYRRLNGGGCLVALYLGLISTQVVLIRFKNGGSLTRWIYDLIFPTICILLVFDSLGRLVHSINPRDMDPLLIRLDFAIFGFYPTVAVEKFMDPLLTDVLQLAYSSYYFLPVSLGVYLKIKKEDAALDHSLFLIMLCFYLSYIGYLFAPALGPRYTMSHLQGADLRGYFIAGPIQNFLNGLEGIKRDAFPSGHTGIALTVLYLSRVHTKGLYRIFLPCVIMLIVSTVCCRYHYVVDVIGGMLLALITLLLGEVYYGYRAERIDTYR